ncbi:MoaD/ThiS family protein [Dehalococcoidia bacterium]|nr:MoaD/ThiS family protein [Dehalococcoidia bacterium]MCL0098297.1 MoaD/ThiS family protein [Dehalococcoidia bacterium]MCL0104073.1 MoaD/ThiS family protein [Dehalococcoidia bacterium]
MSIKVKFMSALRSVTGTPSVELDPSFSTLEKVMEELLRLYPPLKDEMFYPDGTIDFVYQLILNGERLSWPDDKDVKVCNGDQLVFMVFMAGG